MLPKIAYMSEPFTLEARVDNKTTEPALYAAFHIYLDHGYLDHGLTVTGQPNYQATGEAPLWAALDALFNEVETANEKMPEQFDPSISPDIPAAVDSAATVYLATDVFRPRGGWTFSAKKRALKRERQEVMDERAWFAALTLKRARLYLGR
jgi:hypothetical protein